MRADNFTFFFGMYEAKVPPKKSKGPYRDSQGFEDVHFTHGTRPVVL